MKLAVQPAATIERSNLVSTNVRQKTDSSEAESLVFDRDLGCDSQILPGQLSFEGGCLLVYRGGFRNAIKKRCLMRILSVACSPIGSILRFSTPGSWPFNLVSLP